MSQVSANTEPLPWLTIPQDSSTPLAQLSRNLLILDYIISYPAQFVNQILQKIFQDTFETIKPFIKNTFNSSFKDSFYFIGDFFFITIQTTAPYILEAFKTSKFALRLMLSDLFEAFISPLAESASKSSLSLNGASSIGMIAIALLTHQLALDFLKEDPKQACSITYGAITGIVSSYVMDHNIFIGTLAGASVGLIADTAVDCITYNSVTIFFKNLYKKFKIQERAETIHSFTSKVFPYLYFTLGTSLVYSRISPILTRILEEEDPIESKKTHIMKVIVTSGMLFGMGKSYLTPLLKSFLVHVKIGAQSAHDTGIIASWAPRVLSILSVTALLSKR